ncbi:MAG: GNAT family N-acetyltransferase [Crocinitomicaceae bacterium]|nr:GNAT family N-acetyltransferase [Crocinitomicaceae bacterium]
MKYRLIQLADNAEIARVIRGALEEFGVNQPGTVYTDPTTDDLYALFRDEKSAYWIAEENGSIFGGCGIYPTTGLPNGYGELVKLYLRKEVRGRGIGQELMLKSIDSAREMGYAYLYLESLPELNQAVELYKKVGFKLLPNRLGESGHFACDLWMELEI